MTYRSSYRRPAGVSRANVNADPTPAQQAYVRKLRELVGDETFREIEIAVLGENPFDGGRTQPVTRAAVSTIIDMLKRAAYPAGIYTHDLNRAHPRSRRGRCEDAPCCGCCS